MNLEKLAGNTMLKRQLCQQASTRGLSHAYMLSGQPGIGRHTLAAILCAAHVCSAQAGEQPCYTCVGCRKADAAIHPDIIQVGEDQKDITVAQIRSMRSDAYIRPNEAARKVYLIENAQTMNASAQNALLKLLEEGPPYAVFLLITESASALLPTVRSRCEILTLSPVTEDQALTFLQGRFPGEAAQRLAHAAAQCEGILGRAVAQLEGVQDDTELWEAAYSFTSRLCSGDELSLLEFTVSLEKWDRDRLRALLDALILLFRDALFVFSGTSSGQDSSRRACAADIAAKLSQRSVLSMVGQLEQIRGACSFHIGGGHLCGWLTACLINEISGSPA